MAAHSGSRSAGTQVAAAFVASEKMLYVAYALTEGIPIARTPRDRQIVREVMYVRYPGDEAYCLPTCRSLSSLTPARLMLFGLRERAEAAGLRPCRDCRPDVHPISR